MRLLILAILATFVVGTSSGCVVGTRRHGRSHHSSSVKHRHEHCHPKKHGKKVCHSHPHGHPHH